MSRETQDQIEIVPAFDGQQGKIFVLISDWSVNGSSAQSRGLTIDEIDVVIDRLYEARQSCINMERHGA